MRLATIPHRFSIPGNVRLRPALRPRRSNDRWGFGVAVGDYDNDGWPDLYVTNFGKNRLYHNNHDGTFTDVAGKAGVALGSWSNGPAFGDYDGDGKLDLFVPGYVHLDLNRLPLPEGITAPSGECPYSVDRAGCKASPTTFFTINPTAPLRTSASRPVWPMTSLLWKHRRFRRRQ
jgi:hypothetical protein